MIHFMLYRLYTSMLELDTVWLWRSGVCYQLAVQRCCNLCHCGVCYVFHGSRVDYDNLL